MGSLTFSLHLILSFLLASSILLEFHGYYVRTLATLNVQSSSLSLSNWIVYVARILNVSFAFALAFAFEFGLELQLSVIFLVGFLFGFLLSLLYWKTGFVEELGCRLLWRLVFFSHASLKACRYWRPVRLGFSKRGTSMMACATAAYGALIVPFFVARHFPEYRMASVYAGQAFNFLSTFVLLTIVEPRMMLDLDRANAAGGDAKGVDGFIAGRLWLTGVMVVICGIWIVFFSE